MAARSLLNDVLGVGTSPGGGSGIRTYQPVTAVQAQAGYAITATSTDILVELTQDLTAAGTFTLPTGVVGAVVSLVRHGGGSFDWTRTGAGADLTDVMKGRDEELEYQCITAPSTWARVIRRGGDKRLVYRIDQALLTLNGGWEGVDMVFHTTACEVRLPNDMGTRFHCRLIQQTAGAPVSLNYLSGAIPPVGSSQPTATAGIGDELDLLVIQNATGVGAVYRVYRPAGTTFNGSANDFLMGDGSAQTPTGALADLDAVTTPLVRSTLLQDIVGAGSGISGNRRVTGTVVSTTSHTAASGDRSKLVPCTAVCAVTIGDAQPPGTYLYHFTNAGGGSVLGGPNVKMNGVNGASVTFDADGVAVVEVLAGTASPNLGVKVSGPGMRGAVNMAGDQLVDAELRDIAETAPAPGTWAGALSLDYRNGGLQRGTTGASNISSVTVTNWPAANRVGCLTLVFTQGATARTITTWGTAYRFPGGTDFTLTASAGAVDIFTLMTWDAGVTVYAFEGGKAFAI